MSKFDQSVFFNQLISNLQTQYHSARLRRMATLVSSVTIVAVVVVFGLVAAGSSVPDDDDLSAVRRSLLGVPSESVAKRFSLARSQSADEFLPPAVKQSDLFISVKTSKQFHQKRLDVILKTWFQLARDETWFFTDEQDDTYDDKTSKPIHC
jgi:hypothetical protein